MELISWKDFDKVELRVGTIIDAHTFEEAHKPAYKLKVDFGPDIGMKRSSAQLTELYSIEDLIGKQVVGVVNFPPKQIGPTVSECLITGFYREDNSVILAIPDKNIHNGAKLG